jgi:diadenosine tetraphosphate (Ap4A) HIT family hydrolase
VLRSSAPKFAKRRVTRRCSLPIETKRTSMPNQTMTRFGYPETLIREYDHWVVVLREPQVTLGSLILCAKSRATAFSKLPAGAFEEMEAAVNDIERALSEAFHYDKINYLMLMMVDPNVHFHVFPRFATPRSACGVTIADAGWPAAPKLDSHRELTLAEREALCRHLSDFW